MWNTLKCHENVTTWTVAAFWEGVKWWNAFASHKMLFQYNIIKAVWFWQNSFGAFGYAQSYLFVKKSIKKQLQDLFWISVLNLMLRFCKKSLLFKSGSRMHWSLVQKTFSAPNKFNDYARRDFQLSGETTKRPLMNRHFLRSSLLFSCFSRKSRWLRTALILSRKL